MTQIRSKTLRLMRYPYGKNCMSHCMQCKAPFSHGEIIVSKANEGRHSKTPSRRYCEQCAIRLHIYIPEIDDR